jgi:cell division protein FtsB
MPAPTPRPRRAVTGRALVLGTVVVLLLVLLASPLNRYFGSRSEVGGAAKQLQQDQQQLARLRRQQALWSDPGYVQRQARERLQYAMPGDTVYVVADPTRKNQIAATVGASAVSRPTRSWNTTLWNSVQRADAP